MQVQAYLFFDGRCDEALDFYRETIGAKVGTVMRWKDCPDESARSGPNADKVMHAQFEVGDTAILASDGRNSGAPKFDGFALTITAPSEAEADRCSMRSPTAARSPCRWPRPSSRRASACSPTNSACTG